MTKGGEEKIIQAVGELTGKMDRLMKEFDSLKPLIATHEEMLSVRKTIVDHIDDHTQSRRFGWGQIIAIMAAAIPGVIALFKKGV